MERALFPRGGVTIVHAGQISTISLSDTVKLSAIVPYELFGVRVRNTCPRDGPVIKRKITPVFTRVAYFIKAFCVLLFGIRTPLRIAAEWGFRITNKFGDAWVNTTWIGWIIGEIPMVRKRFAVVRVKCFIR